MISVEDRERIRRAYFTEKKSQRQIAKELGHSRKTVRKALESAEPSSYRIRKPREAPVLGPYKDRIDEILEENERLCFHIPVGDARLRQCHRQRSVTEQGGDAL